MHKSAQYAAEKLIGLGAHVVTFSDSDGTVYDPDGIDEEKLQYVKQLKNVKRGRIREYADKYNATYLENKKPWEVQCHIALPCATENELDAIDAMKLVENGCICIAEGANKPAKPEAIAVFWENDTLFGPGKAANAGGVAVSGLEMSQNRSRTRWTQSEVDGKLQTIMKNIHKKCIEYGEENQKINYLRGANIAGFIKVADAMLQQGVV